MSARRLGPLGWIALCIALVIALFPIEWMAMTSIKQPHEWNASPAIWVTEKPTFLSYQVLFDPTALATTGIGAVSASATAAVKGSLIASIAATVCAVAIGLAAALALSRYSSGGGGNALSILSGRMFPPAAIAVPFVIVFSVVRLIDSYVGLVAVYTAVTMPLATWMLKSFIDDVPREIEEAAMLDGRSRLGAHLTVTLPLIRGGLFSTTLFIFILNWSEFLLALVLSYNNVITIPVQLAKYVTATAGTLYGVQAALAIVAALPLVVCGWLIQTHLVRGMTFGAIKR
jgi:multiple sugar transport system permease protein